ncbi:hypothetical protein VTO42DRAFT_3290 [Malbranchea cinnamomea]
MESLGRPKRAGEEFARTHHNDYEQDGPSSSKKPRFDLRNPSTLAPDDLEEDHILDADEFGRRGQRVRRNAVNIDGYDSDSENDAFDARAEAKAKMKRQEAQEDDDMFAELEEDFGDGSPGRGKKKKQIRFLEDDEIEGQVEESRSGGKVTLDDDNGKGKQKEGEELSDSDTDEEGRAALNGVDKELGAGAKKKHAPLLDAFNMRAEQEEGRFDEAGNYIRKAADPDAIHDSWLEGVSRRDIRKAKQAAEKRAEELRRKTLANDSILTSDVLKTLIIHLERGETVLEALAKLGKGAKQRSKWQNKNKNRSKKKNGGTEDVEMGEDDPTEAARKRAIEEITEAADVLLTRGQTDIYDTERELLIRLYRRETGEDWVDPPKEDLTGSSADDQNSKWEFRWSDARDGGQIHGPYERSMMKSWNDAGYFGEGVEFRRVGGSGEWVRTADFA